MEGSSGDDGPTKQLWLYRLQTLSIFLAIFTLGLVTAVLGVALIDLSQLFETTIESTSKILITRAIGFLTGSLLSSSVIYRFVNGKKCIIISLIIGGFANALIPAFNSIVVAHVCLFVAGLSIGVLEVGGNVWLVHMWKQKVAPMFQMYHLCFGIGALVAPIVTEPFLSIRSGSTMDNATDVTFMDTQIAVPFALFGSSYGVVGLLLFILYRVDTSNFQPEDSSSSGVSIESSSKDEHRRRDEWVIVCHLVVYIFVQVSLESTISQMIGVYVVSNAALSFDKSTASFLLAVFWSLYTGGRITALVLSFRVRPFRIILAMQTLCVVGTLILMTVGTTEGYSLWISAAILGFGLSPLYASVMSWAVSYVSLQYVHMTLVLVASCMGQMMPALTVAPWLQTKPVVFVNVTSAWMLAHTINLGFMHLNSKRKSLRSGVHLTLNSKDNGPGLNNSP